MMEDLLKHLTEVSLRQQQIMEHMASRQGEMERELAALRMAATPRTPLPDPRVQATQLIPKMTGHDDVETFLQMFEAIAAQEAWPRDEWARIVAPLLTGEAQRAYFMLGPERSGSYEELKKEILGWVGLSPISAAQLFQDWSYNPRRPARAQVTDLSRLAQHWLLAGGPTAHQVTERVVVDGLLRALPRPLWQVAGMRNPTNVDELVEAIELAEATQHREAGERAPPFPRRVVQERRAPEGTQRPVGRPAVPGPQDEPMPTEAPHSPGRAWLAGCAVHAEPPKQAPRAEVNINGRPVLALLDSGSGVTLIRPTVLPPRPEPKARLSITCVAVEKEALAVKWAVLELRYYLLGRQFTLITFQVFHFTVQHQAGTANANADGLSRIWSAFAGLSGSTPRPPPISQMYISCMTNLKLFAQAARA
uniref:SCAN box domain-containing protein n=1 Tax=Cyprinus carpio TaxID=7962 RepID=A0A8C2KCW7_CYPCA